VYTPTDRLACGQWGAGIAWQAHRPSYGGCGAERLPTNSQLSRPTLARQAIGRYIHFAVVDRASVRIRLSLRINISLTVGEIYKMVEDFSTQFSPLYLSMKYLAIISRHFAHTHTHTHTHTQNVTKILYILIYLYNIFNVKKIE